MGKAGLPRWFDASAACLALVVSAPVLLVAAALVRISSRGPVLFRQERVGRHGVRFEMVKLRTMRVGGDGPLVTSRGDPRITAVGRWLRLLKVDELPALWNVLRGDMALVGPRPEVPSLVDGSEPLWQEVLSVRPGLTDPATLALRSEEELMASIAGERGLFYRNVLQPYKLRRYCEYLAVRTWRSDVRTLLKTAFAIIRPSLFPPPSREDLEREGTALAGRRDPGSVPHV